MASQVEICNMALGQLGCNTITAIDEESTESIQCEKYFTQVLNGLLRQYPWTFASKTYALATADDDSMDIAEADLWANIYTYPAKALRIWSVFAGGNYNQDHNNFEIISTGDKKFVCSNIDSAYARCTIKITDYDILDPLFTDAFAYKLAMALASPLDATKYLQTVTQLYQMAIGQAMLSNSTEGQPIQRPQRMRAGGFNSRCF